MAAAAAAAARGAAAGPAAWDQVWQQQQQQQLQQQRPVSTGWADDFAVQQHQQQSAWAEEFSKAEAAAGPQGWATEFSEAQEAAVASTPEAAAAAAADARATSARLVDALTADGDPKMRNSKFLQFLSKMSKGELEFEDNKVGTFIKVQPGLVLL
jgi:peroxin-5